MGIWSEIKYALNSTLGTSDFKPLDKYIESLISIVPSNDLIYETEILTNSTAHSEDVIFDKIMNIGGTFRIVGGARHNVTNRDEGYTFIVRINGATVTNEYIGIDVGEDAAEKTYSVSFEKGDTVEIAAMSSRNVTYAYTKIYGSATLGKMFA